MNWFDVDKLGLAKLLEKRGKAFAVFELLQNAWDTNATRVDLNLDPIASSPFVRVTVEDNDPEGFSKLEHAFTLFAESDKKSDPTKRGRFNLGEKLVLALCRYASIKSTKGMVEFTDRGRHTSVKTRREVGSCFVGEMRMTRDELADVRAKLKTLLPPANVGTYVDGERLPPRPFFRSVGHVTLETEISDAEGFLRKTKRQTSIAVYAVLPGETPHLYEMGIPVVELPGDCWHVEVLQKIPLNVDRDNVTQAFLRSVRVEVLNVTTDLLTADAAAQPWVNDAAGDERVSSEAVTKVLDLRFGSKRVIADPSDPEGTKLAMSQGYTVIPGGALSSDVWLNVRRFVAALPAGQVTPSPKPYSPDGDPEKVIPRKDWKPEYELYYEWVRKLGVLLLGSPVETRFVREPNVSWRATFGGLLMALNVSKLGPLWWSEQEEMLSLVLHELGHHYSGDHLSSDYHRAICDLGARLAIKGLPKFDR